MSNNHSPIKHTIFENHFEIYSTFYVFHLSHSINTYDLLNLKYLKIYGQL